MSREYKKDGKEAQSPYADIIDLPHYEPRRHPRMEAEKRAAQFAPFAALTGFDQAVDETARQTQARVEEENRGVKLEDQD